MANLGYLQIIRQCNQKCLFCSNPDNNNIISFAEGKKYIDEFIKNGYQGVILTGGEPTLHPEIIKFVRYCREKNIEPRIITNGQKTADFALLDKLKNSGLDLMHVSVQSVKPKTQAYLSSNQDSLRNILRTLINARKMKININLNIVINSLNAEDLPLLVQFFIRSFPEIKHYVFNNLDPEMNRVQENLFLIPKFKSFKRSLPTALKLLKKYNKSFRVERVPLCYMGDFAAFSTETRKIVKSEERTILFLDKRRDDKFYRQTGFFYNKFDECRKCSLTEICAGLFSYKYNDSRELSAQKKDKQKIIDEIIKED